MIYHCPKCQKEMKHSTHKQITNLHMYKCCSITFYPHSYDDGDCMIIYNESQYIIFRGTFKYCCKQYKFLAFQ